MSIFGKKRFSFGLLHAPTVNYLFSYLVIVPFGCEKRPFVLIVFVPYHCLYYY